ncbi:hypothetical protein VCHA40P240_60205 [Vibrio chagasii]|nr:hypothetical protein VCHA40P240_60205 [Vibrio chagasii]
MTFIDMLTVTGSQRSLSKYPVFLSGHINEKEAGLIEFVFFVRFFIHHIYDMIQLIDK